MKDGCTRREHYIAAGVPQSDWGLPDFPEGMEHIWHWFNRLHRRRNVGMAECALSSVEYLSFFVLEGASPDAWEINALERLDMIAMESAREGQKKNA